MAAPIQANFETFVAQDRIPPQSFTIEKLVAGVAQATPLAGATATITIRDSSDAIVEIFTIAGGELTVDAAQEILTMNSFDAPDTAGTYCYDLEVIFPEADIGRVTLFAGDIPIISGKTRNPNV